MANWVQVLGFAFPPDAYVAKSYLESEEIDVFLRDEISSQVFNVNGGVKLMVPEAQKDRAVELLKDGGFL